MTIHPTAMIHRLSFFLMLMTLLAIATTAQDKVPDSGAKIISSPEFKLPESVEKAGIDGRVVLSISVDETGLVKSIVFSAGPSWPCGADPAAELDELRAAIRAHIMGTKFAPEIKNGKPRSSLFTAGFAIGEAYQKLLRKREREEAIKNGIEPPIIVKAGVVNGRALKLPRPEYPQVARMSRIGGPVMVEVSIDENGQVARAGAVSGQIALQRAARDAACEAKFSPTSVEGKRVRVDGVITYVFSP